MKKLIALLIGSAILSIALSGCNKAPSANNEPTEHQAVGRSEDKFERGPHNGRLLRDGDFAIEVSIFEQGVAPEFRVYATQQNQSIAPTALQVTINLTRFAGVTDRHDFSARHDYLVSNAEVVEPHSFDVEVLTNYRGKPHRWTYASYEGRTTIAPAAASASGIRDAAVAPGVIEERIALYGAIQADATRVRSVGARFAGVIRRVDVAVGESVRAGQTLALIESNESLQTYALHAPIDGTLIQRHANAGEATSTEALFEIADYSQVWALLNVFPRDRARVQIGQAVFNRAADGSAAGSGSIAVIATNKFNEAMPTAQSARVVLDNRNQQWTPGQFVNAEVTVAKTQAALVLPLAALQTFRDWDVVFLHSGETYQAQPVRLGKRDASNVEIVGGLSAGMNVVVANSYLVKADIEKAGASHDH